MEKERGEGGERENKKSLSNLDFLHITSELHTLPIHTVSLLSNLRLVTVTLKSMSHCGSLLDLCVHQLICSDTVGDFNPTNL